MRSAIVQLPDLRSHNQQRAVLRAAIRQLERADLYLSAVASMDIGGWEVERTLRQVRSDLEGLRRSFVERRSELIP